MNALDNIIKSIDADTDDKINMLKSKTQTECELILSTAKTEAKKETTESKKNTAAEVEQILSKAKTRDTLFKKQTILKTKQILIDKSLSIAKQKLFDMDKDEYFSFIKSLVSDNLPPEDFSLVFGSKDFSRIPNSFIDDIKQSDKQEVDTQKSDSFDYGVKIITKKAVLDFSIDSIFSDKEDDLRVAASKALGLGDLI